MSLVYICNYHLVLSSSLSLSLSLSSFPTSNWESISSFQMRNERGVQEFPLADTVYAKYIKIVMLSHFGSEHYCPISVVCVYGATMIEEYEYSEQSENGRGGENDEDKGKITTISK